MVRRWQLSQDLNVSHAKRIDDTVQHQVTAVALWSVVYDLVHDTSPMTSTARHCHRLNESAQRRNKAPWNIQDQELYKSWTSMQLQCRKPESPCKLSTIIFSKAPSLKSKLFVLDNMTTEYLISLVQSIPQTDCQMSPSPTTYSLTRCNISDSFTTLGVT